MGAPASGYEGPKERLRGGAELKEQHPCLRLLAVKERLGGSHRGRAVVATPGEVRGCLLFILLVSNWINSPTSCSNGSFSIRLGSGHASQRHRHGMEAAGPLALSPALLATPRPALLQPVVLPRSKEIVQSVVSGTPPPQPFQAYLALASGDEPDLCEGRQFLTAGCCELF